MVLFGLTVATVLSAPDTASLPRDLDVAELWSGVGAIVHAAVSHGLRAAPFDKFRCLGVTDVDGPDTEDITTNFGFRRALRNVLSLRRGGLLCMAPVCSSFGFANMRNTKRNRDNVRGDESYPAVKQGNLMADIAAFLMCVAVARHVHCCIENPAGSMLFTYLSPITSLFPGLDFGTADRCAYDTKPLGQRSKKPYKFLTSGPWLRPGLRKCTCPGSAHESLMVANDRDQVTGRTALLRASAAYPAALGEAIVDAWLAADTLPDVPVSDVQRSSGAAAKRTRCVPAREAHPRVHPPPGDWPGTDFQEDPWVASGEETVPESTKDVHEDPWEEGDANNKTSIVELDDAAASAEMDRRIALARAAKAVSQSYRTPSDDWPNHCFDDAKSVSEGEACRSPGPWNSTASPSAAEPDDPWPGE